MKARSTIVFLLFFLYSLGSVLANQTTDSLLIQLRSSSKNKDKSLLFNEMSRSYVNSNLDSALYFAKRGFVLASEIDYSTGMAENAASIADYYIVYDSLDKAKEYYILAGNYFEELGKEFDYAELMMVLGNIYLTQNNYSEALVCYQKSQAISEANDFNTIFPHVYNNTGILYSNLGEKDKALEHYMKAYEGFKAINLSANLAHVVSNIASIHLSKNKDSQAIQYYYEALRIFDETGNLVGSSLVYNDLGDYELNNSNYEGALVYYKKALEHIGNQEEEYLGPKSLALARTFTKLGTVYALLEDNKQAIFYLKEALKLSLQNHYLSLIESNALELSKIYEKKGQLVEALTYYKTYEEYGDSLLNESSIKKITQLEMQFEFDKKARERALEDAKNKAKQQRKEFMYILFIGLGVFIVIIVFLMYLNQRNKTSKVELKRQNLKLEHEKLHQELEHRNKELATNVMYLLSKNEFITNTAEKLTKAKMSFKKENQKIIQDVIRELLMNSSKDVWKEFEVRFQEVHSDFYDNLNARFPDLTPNEKKICAFLRLNMSTKDICAITYQSVRSVNMARFRLRKKIGLDTDENLVSFLSQI